MNAPGSSVTIRNSIFTGNQAISSQAPGGRGIGGAIENSSAVLVIAGSRFNGNSARRFQPRSERSDRQSQRSRDDHEFLFHQQSGRWAREPADSPHQGR